MYFSMNDTSLLGTQIEVNSNQMKTVLENIQYYIIANAIKITKSNSKNQFGYVSLFEV